MATSNSLEIKAALNAAGITSGVTQAMREFTRFERETAGIAEQLHRLNFAPDLGRSVQAAREVAHSTVDALEATFVAEATDIKAKLFLGLTSGNEAAQAGRQVGEKYVAGLKGVLTQLHGLEQTQDVIGDKVIVLGKLEQATRSLAPAAGAAGIGLNALRGPLTSLATQAAGATPAVGQLTSIVGTMALGAPEMIAVLAGLAAISVGYKKLTEDAREAAKATEEQIEKLKQFSEQQRVARLGPGGDLREVRENAKETLRQLDEQRAKLQKIREEALEIAKVGGLIPLAAGLSAYVRAQQQIKDNWADTAVAVRAYEDAVEAAARATSEAFLTQAFSSADRIRQAEQAVTLAGLEGVAARRLAVDFEAQNRVIEAQRTLKDYTLKLALAEMEIVRKLKQEEITRAEALRLQNEHLKKQEELFKRLAAIEFPNLAGAQRMIAGTPFNQAAFEEQRRAHDAEVERRDAFFRAGGHLSPVTVASTPQSRAGAPRELSGTVQAVREITNGFEALSGVLGDTSEALSGTFRGLNDFVSGIEQIRNAQTNAAGALTAAGAATAASGALSIVASVVGIVDAFRQQSARIQEARRQIERDLDDWANALNPGTQLDQAKRDAKKQFREVVTGIADAFGEGFFKRPENLDPDTANLALIREMASVDIGDWLPGGLLDNAAREYLKALDLYNEATRQATENLRAFANTLDEARQQRELGNKLRGVDLDPKQELAGLLNDLKNTFPALFEKIFAGVDLSDLDAVRQAAIDAFETFTSLSGAALEEWLAGISPDEFRSWLSLFGDSINEATRSVRDMNSALRGVPEVFNFTLASLRAAGVRNYVPPTTFEVPGRNTGRTAPSQDNSTTVAAGAVQISISADEGRLLDRVAEVVATGLAQAARLGGKTLTAGEIRVMLKAELQRAAQSNGEGSKNLALAWPGGPS